MKATILLTLGLFFLSITIQAQFNNKYRTDEGKASISFPTEYTVAEENKDYGKFVSVTAKEGAITYMFSYSIHNQKLSDQDYLSEFAMNEFAKKIEGKIKDVKPYKYNSNVGKRALILIKKKKVKVKYFSLIIGQIQYQLAIIAPKKEDFDEKIQKFIDSLFIDRE